MSIEPSLKKFWENWPPGKWFIISMGDDGIIGRKIYV